MTKKDLQNYRARKREAQNLSELIAELESQMASPRSQRLSGMPSGGHSDPDKMSGLVARHSELLELYRQNRQTLIEAQTSIEHTIASLEPTERELLRRRYIQGEQWDEIAMKMSYSPRQIHRIHGSVLCKLKQM